MRTFPIAPFLRIRSGLFATVFLSIFFIAIPLTMAQEEPALPDLSSSDIEKLHDGEILVEVDQGDDINRGVVIGLIQDPLNDVVTPVAECWEYASWRDNISNTRLEDPLNDEAGVILCSGTAETPFPASDRDGDFRVHNRTTTVDGQRSFVSTFDYIEDSGNLADMHGYWIAYPYGENDEHTILKHVLNVDIGSWIPSFLIRWATRNTLPATIWGIRKKLDENGTRSDPLYWESYDYD